ncbi:MAG TPA: translation initiation factor IF-2 associated domain-containing protein, partial [Burkholderiaceae bacterium]|nr:translation initiation factor IF-2 associated domain-containing protein [Burkholderiaceae bacterium]
MAVTTVAQFAAELNRPAATLLEQLQSAGVAKATADDALNDADKERLLDYLRTAHGTAGGERKKITLTRKSTSEIKQADASGKARTIQVEVRKKRTFVQRDDSAVDEQAAAAAAAAQEAELLRREEEARAQAELMRKQEEELAEKRRLREAEEARQRAEAEERAKAAVEAAAKAAAEAAEKAAAEKAAAAEAKPAKGAKKAV